MRRSKAKQVVSMALSASMIIGTMSATPALAASGSSKIRETVLAEDMTVAESVYGWVTVAASENADHTVSVTIMPAGETAEAKFTTAVKYGTSNAMTDASQAGSITGRCTKGTFVEVCLNAAGEVIDIRRVLQDGLNFDTARFGGDLTEIGSEVVNRGADYNDIYNDDDCGETGALTGTSGQMVAMGWLLEKDGDERTITVGDGNRTTDVFNETYKVSDNVKVYSIDNSNSGKFKATKISFNGEAVTADGPAVSDDETAYKHVATSTNSDIWVSTDSDLPSWTATASNATKSDIGLDDEYTEGRKKMVAPVDQSRQLTASELNSDGYIYDTPSDKRTQVIVVFDNDYEHYGDDTDNDAQVVEIYEYTEHADVSAYVGLQPEIVRITSDFSTSKQGSPKPTNAPYLVAAEPITVVENKMWTIGDNEDNCPIFKGGTDDNGGDFLVQFDTGWPRDGYQYMRNIEKTGNDPRELDMILVPHGHGDHYGALYDEWETVVRQKGNEDNSKSPIVYESYEDTIGFDIHGFPEIGGIYTDQSVRSIITNWYPNDVWNELGDGLSMMVTLTPGHTQGTGSAVFDVEVPETMEDAKLTYEYKPNDPEADSEGYVRTYSDYEAEDHIMFAYMGGYGINGLDSAETAGFRRTAFVSSLRYIESVFSNLDVPGEEGRKADGVYNLAQHTNQYPYTETAEVMNQYNEKNETSYPFLHFMREGREEIINFCEKRASAMLYSEYTKKYMEDYEANGNKSPFYTYDGIKIKTDITSTKLKNNTLEDAGPYKHEGGEVEIEIADDVDILVMHGYDVFLNKGVVPESAGIMTRSAETGLAKSNWNVVKGFAFAKDGYVYAPDKWYVQIGAHVQDDYDGNVYSNTGANVGITLKSGPVDSLRGEGWSEIIRTEAMSKEEAEELAASLKQGRHYLVNIKKTGDIINNTDDIMKTFTLVENENLSKAAADEIEDALKDMSIMPESNANEEDVKSSFAAMLKDQLDVFNAKNDSNVKAELLESAYTAPVAGTVRNRNGKDGKFVQTVKFTYSDVYGEMHETIRTFEIVLKAISYQGTMHTGGGSGSSSGSYKSYSTPGNWNQDAKGWRFVKADGSYPKSTWEKLAWEGKYHWYHFDENGYCQGGWFTDTDGTKYYLHNEHDGQFGYMYTGWNQIGGRDFYFESTAGNGQGKLYMDTTTPDGYKVAADGSWMK